MSRPKEIVIAAPGDREAAARSRWRALRGGRCRVCGCTDDRACLVLEYSGAVGPCSWADAEGTLCSACVPEASP